MTVTLLLPFPPRALSPNARPGIYGKAGAVKRYRRDAWIVGCEAKGKDRARFPLPVPVTAHVTFVVRMDRMRDEDNYGAMLKPMWDGLVDAGVLSADDAGALHIERPVFEKGRSSGVVLLLEGAS